MSFSGTNTLLSINNSEIIFPSLSKIFVTTLGLKFSKLDMEGSSSISLDINKTMNIMPRENIMVKINDFLNFIIFKIKVRKLRDIILEK
ncbi:hypothetical protein MASR1M68_07480 [Elusimicrobiota bacterium]